MKAPEISYTYAEGDSMRCASYFHREKGEGGERESEREVTAMGCKELGNISDTSKYYHFLGTGSEIFPNSLRLATVVDSVTPVTPRV